jgi:hypothetical protein
MFWPQPNSSPSTVTHSVKLRPHDTMYACAHQPTITTGATSNNKNNTTTTTTTTTTATTATATTSTAPVTIKKR